MVKLITGVSHVDGRIVEIIILINLRHKVLSHEFISSIFVEMRFTDMVKLMAALCILVDR